VGVGAMLIAAAVAMLAHSGLFGELARAMSSFIALGAAFAARPARGATRGRYYIARAAQLAGDATSLRCAICENTFEPDDMAHCPAYGGTICSLCCSLDSRCHDRCKPHARFASQAARALHRAAGRAARSSPRCASFTMRASCWRCSRCWQRALSDLGAERNFDARRRAIDRPCIWQFSKDLSRALAGGCIAAWWLCWSAKAAASRRKSRSGKPNC
jgi:hypothetical protein